MLVVETVVRVRREYASGKPIREIARDLRLSRKVVRKAIRAPEGAFDYHRSVQPLPRMRRRRWAATQSHPEHKDITVAQALEAELPALQPMLAPFDGFHETSHAVTGTCLISFDRNRYSVAARAVRRAVQFRAYADRIIVRLGDAIIAEHPRCFARDRTIYDPWHYLPVLVTKPGALRNGAPFQGWDLPPALARLRRKLGSGDEADRRFVRVLAAILSDGLEAVEAAVCEALDAGAASDEVILNILSRRREPLPIRSLDVMVDLQLNHPPIADCARYDTPRGFNATA